MAGRQLFSEIEKACLRELVTKYKLNTPATIGAGNPNLKKIAWARLTEEYNSIENNTKRTEAQLKKCWDNLKTRRKQVLALEKRERMKTGGGPYIPQPSTSQEIDDALQDTTDVEMRFVCDSDSVAEVGQVIEVADEAIGQDFHLDQAAGESLEQESIGQELGQSAESPRRSESQLSDHGARATQGQGRSVESPPGRRRSESQLPGHGARATQGQGATNVRARVITEEFNLRKENYEITQRRDEEIHKLKVAEQEWLVKAAQEQYNKARLERECAEELLRLNRVQREEAELRLEILKNKS